MASASSCLTSAATCRTMAPEGISGAFKEFFPVFAAGAGACCGAAATGLGSTGFTDGWGEIFFGDASRRGSVLAGLLLEVNSQSELLVVAGSASLEGNAAGAFLAELELWLAASVFLVRIGSAGEEVF